MDAKSQDARQATYDVMLAGLLHDFGKVRYRADEGSGDHSERGSAYCRETLALPEHITIGIGKHHSANIKADPPADRSNAYIIYAADNISAAADRRESEGLNGTFDKGAALMSIFSSIGGGSTPKYFRADWVGDAVQYPKSEHRNDSAQYRHVLREWENGVRGISFIPEYANSVIDLVKSCFSYIPSSTNNSERCDVSLYHHAKTTAAIACCIERVLRSRGTANYKEILFKNEAAFRTEKNFVLYGVDMSGIQKFIYTIPSQGGGVLKGLRARSFYLSILMEHIADSILEACAMYRTNLIYCGGGKAYLLLPNDGECAQRAQEVADAANDFLRRQFDTELYLATGCVYASANDLTSDGGKSKAFGELFRQVSAICSEKKLHRYSAEQLLELNTARDEDPERECAGCGKTTGLRWIDGNTYRCDTCSRLVLFATEMAQGKDVLAVTQKSGESSLPMPGNVWITALSEAEARGLRGECVRLYGLNKSYTGLKLSCKLSAGVYSAGAQTFGELASNSEGIRRLAVLRADVDNLGMLFSDGFKVEGAKEPWKYATLSRYSALSSAMTEFFQTEINRIVSGAPEAQNARDVRQGSRNVSIVYAGGDDVFLVGAWNEVLETALDLRQAFARYAGDSVTLSAGWGMFHEKEPIALMAAECDALEGLAKAIPDGKKNAIALFGRFAVGRNEEEYVFHWDELANDILGSKMPIVESAVGGDSEKGNSFLYGVLQLVKASKKDANNMARLVYHIARHAPDRNASKEKAAAYDAFSGRICNWAIKSAENVKLQAAILLNVYKHREEAPK